MSDLQQEITEIRDAAQALVTRCDQILVTHFDRQQPRNYALMLAKRIESLSKHEPVPSELEQMDIMYKRGFVSQQERDAFEQQYAQALASEHVENAQERMMQALREVAS